MKISRYCLAVIVVLAGMSPIASAQYLKGIDVSHWENVYNWNSVRNAGNVFAFTKATENTDYIDPTLNSYMTGAHDAGIYIGAFHFATPYGNSRGDIGGPNDAVAEARHFASTIRPYLTDGYLRPVLDLEVNSGVGRARMTVWVHDFMNEMKRLTGVEPLIYCNSNYAKNFLDSSVARYDLWLARWTYDPNVLPKYTDPGAWTGKGWDFWQYSDSLTVPGISGYTDGDIFKGTLADLQQKFVIPEPMTLALLGLGGLGLIRCRYR